MNFKALAARFALVVSCGLMTATPAAAQFWQCVTFARSVSGIEIRGNANTWWSQAEGRYERGHAPKAGAVLAFSPTSRMRESAWNICTLLSIVLVKMPSSFPALSTWRMR